MLTTRNAKEILEQALLDSPLFRIRWRWNATRALLVPRMKGGKRVPPPLQRFRADDLLTSVFPASTACLENRPENIELPDHPIVLQTMKDCLFEATDCCRFIELLDRVRRGEVTLVAHTTHANHPRSVINASTLSRTPFWMMRRSRKDELVPSRLDGRFRSKRFGISAPRCGFDPSSHERSLAQSPLC